MTTTREDLSRYAPTPLVDHGDESAPGVVVVRVLLHVLGKVHNLLRQDGHHDARRARVLVVLAPLELRGLPRQLVKVSLQKTKRRHHVVGAGGGHRDQGHRFSLDTKASSPRALAYIIEQVGAGLPLWNCERAPLVHAKIIDIPVSYV